MSSPTSTPGSRKRGRNGNPGTRKFICSTVPLGATEMIVGGVCVCVLVYWYEVVFVPCVFSASSEGPTSPPSQRRRGQDSSTGDLMQMPTSPATDMLSPAAPQDTSLFSSPRPSGSNHTKCPDFKLFWSGLALPNGNAGHF